MAKHLLDELARPGPHQVLRGDLALVGLPGLVFTPSAGLGLPAVAFGHGWLQPPLRYRGLLRHLASWGIVVAVPGTHLGPFGSHRLLAADLRTALDVCVGVRLGEGAISVDPERLGVAGHSTGGGSAVLAAAADSRVRAVATLAVAQTRPLASEAAARCSMPSLHVLAGQDLVAPAGAHGDLIARAWGGSARVRTIEKASHLGFVEGRHWSDLLVAGRGEHATQRVARALLTAFFLGELGGDGKYLGFLDENVKGVEVGFEKVAA
ncbi:dienelactone hydrolase family protein [Actinokineospora enzanensis]|uniref:dienelactone hydrolase family protein n=1 Tax=Actinokineospora enzanensis TaxID=155975 RepID=UPI000381BB8F|nr:alpha/beta hydrolase [Actinokineospora enzanensis]